MTMNNAKKCPVCPAAPGTPCISAKGHRRSVPHVVLVAPEIQILQALRANPVSTLSMNQVVTCNGNSIRCEALINLGFIARSDTSGDYRTNFIITDAGLHYLSNLETSL